MLSTKIDASLCIAMLCRSWIDGPLIHVPTTTAPVTTAGVGARRRSAAPRQSLDGSDLEAQRGGVVDPLDDLLPAEIHAASMPRRSRTPRADVGNDLARSRRHMVGSLRIPQR
jgi:hypothetical protein